MVNETAQMWSRIFDSFNGDIKTIREEIYKLVGDNFRDAHLQEYIQENLENFQFNLVEIQLQKDIQDVVDQTIKKIENQDISSLDQQQITAQLIASLNSLRTPNITLDNDFNDLSKGIINKFNFPESMLEEFRAYFKKHNEKIMNIINGYNQSVIDSLTKSAPSFVGEIVNTVQLQKATKQEEKIQTQSNLNTDESVKSMSAEEIIENVDNMILEFDVGSQMEKVTQSPVDRAIEMCQSKKAKLEIIFHDPKFASEKSNIARSMRQVNKLIEELSKGTHTEILNKVSDYAIDSFISQQIPGLENYLVEDMRKDINQPKPNNPTPSVDTYIGATEEEIRLLISQNQYFPILQSISKYNLNKYSSFIHTGYRIIIEQYYQRAQSCTTYEERHNSYFELYEIYQNFRDYVSPELSQQLQEQLNEMQKFLNQKQNDEIVGIRYNEASENSRSTMRK